MQNITKLLNKNKKFILSNISIFDKFTRFLFFKNENLTIFSFIFCIQKKKFLELKKECLKIWCFDISMGLNIKVCPDPLWVSRANPIVQS
jgi:hypothetical protein